MNKLMILGAALTIASLTGCATSPAPTQATAAYNPPKTFNYNNSKTSAGLTTSNGGSMFDDNETWENDKL